MLAVHLYLLISTLQQKRYVIDNGMNSKNIVVAMFYWYYKKLLPKKLGGFH